MKTEMALILMNDGNPVMTLAKVGKLINIGERTAENQVYAQTFPVPAFKLGSKWFCHVTDVAAHIDEQRAAAMELLQHQRKAA